MKQVLLVSSSSAHRDEAETTRQFIEEVLGGSAQCLLTYLDKLQFSISATAFRIYDTIHNRELKDYDLIVLRGPEMRAHGALAYCVSRYCQLQKVPSFNDYSLYYTGSKITQTILFFEQGAPFLKTLYAAESRLLIDLAKQELSLPFILKDNTGAHGESNYLVRSWEEAERIVSDEPGIDFIAQEFCKNNCDYRVLLFGSDHLVFKRIGSEESHLNNTSKGAQAVPAPHELPIGIINMSHQLSKQLGLYVSGVDVVPRLGSDEFYFLEINSQPQLRTGALLDEKKRRFKRVLESHLNR